MRLILFVLGLIALASGIAVAGTIRSDIQVQILATCLIGAMLMFGQVAILSGQRRLIQLAKKQSDTAK